jgi:DUF4097 and DUF4098 domain-containing protein YvlB
MKSVLLLSVALVVLASGAPAAVTETFKQSYPLEPTGTVSLDNVNGDIDIVGWDKAEVALEAEKKGKTDADLAKVSLEIDATPAKLTIKTKYAKMGWFGSIHASVRYKLMVPAGARLEKIDSVNSAITVAGVRGSVNLDTVNGSIRATGLAGDARLDSVNGSLEAEFVSVERVQKVKLDSVNGSAEVTLPKGASARIDAGSVNGRVNVDQPIRLTKSHRRSLAGQIGAGGPEISLETVNGSIAIKEK